ncbi:MAG: hypothetical protein GY867_11710 [bacterium]|nr:hypothetical protein [bacterium]
MNSQQNPAADQASGPHSFHIPVMGTGFTIDTPLQVARFGISSVISIGDDVLIEQMRKTHCDKNGLPFEAISEREEDYRARRITAYLNLIERLVRRQTEALRAAPFEPDSEITRYFELLPETPLKQAYRDMCLTTDPGDRLEKQKALRKEVRAGNIDVNIMTKVDFTVMRNGDKLGPEYGVAMTALRGFAKSNLTSSIVFSAGMNRRLFSYASGFEDFLPDQAGNLKKKITLKVSDFRSARLQGKLLAKRGLWVSEYRIESGLNCGGHAFATKGFLMGPILEEFKQQKSELTAQLFAVYRKALQERWAATSDLPPNVRVTVQGGVGTSDEHSFLMKYYSVDGTGWGTPFLLVPEVTNVDPDHLAKLSNAGTDDVRLGEGSPLGVPFWALASSASESMRLKRISRGRPGSECPKGYLMSNTEFTSAPICPASRIYQKRKLKELSTLSLPDVEHEARQKSVLAKLCLCQDLAAGAMLKNKLDSDFNAAVCCGPGIADFSQITSLDKMVDHIYGRLSLLTGANRPHVFTRELGLYVDFLRDELEKAAVGLLDRTSDYFSEFAENLASGISYYRNLAAHFGQSQQERFLEELDALVLELEKLFPETAKSLPASGVA